MLSVDTLSINFETSRGLAQVLDRVSLEIAPGEIVGLVGRERLGQVGPVLRDQRPARSGSACHGRRAALERQAHGAFA